MARDKHLPLTETVYSIMLALRQPLHGYAIMQRVENLSGGDVRMAAGTLYGALENLTKAGLIQRLPSEDPRRKVYGLTPYGHQVLAAETERMRRLVALATTPDPNPEGKIHA